MAGAVSPMSLLWGQTSIQAHGRLELLASLSRAAGEGDSNPQEMHLKPFQEVPERLCPAGRRKWRQWDQDPKTYVGSRYGP